MSHAPKIIKLPTAISIKQRRTDEISSKRVDNYQAQRVIYSPDKYLAGRTQEYRFQVLLTRCIGLLDNNYLLFVQILLTAGSSSWTY